MQAFVFWLASCFNGKPKEIAVINSEKRSQKNQIGKKVNPSKIKVNRKGIKEEESIREKKIEKKTKLVKKTS